MTKEEAIKGLKVLRRDFSGYKPNEEMFDMAIQALEQEPSCRNTRQVDLISRQAAINAVYTSSGTGTALKALKALPSAQPFTTEQIQTMQELESAQIEKAYELGKADRPTGYWLDAREEDPCWYICSECKRMVDDDSNYCPNCGVRMESDGE